MSVLTETQLNEMSQACKQTNCLSFCPSLEWYIYDINKNSLFVHTILRKTERRNFKNS